MNVTNLERFLGAEFFGHTVAHTCSEISIFVNVFMYIYGMLDFKEIRVSVFSLRIENGITSISKVETFSLLSCSNSMKNVSYYSY